MQLPYDMDTLYSYNPYLFSFRRLGHRLPMSHINANRTTRIILHPAFCIFVIEACTNNFASRTQIHCSTVIRQPLRNRDPTAFRRQYLYQFRRLLMQQIQAPGALIVDRTLPASAGVIDLTLPQCRDDFIRFHGFLLYSKSNLLPLVSHELGRLL